MKRIRVPILKFPTGKIYILLLVPNRLLRKEANKGLEFGLILDKLLADREEAIGIYTRTRLSIDSMPHRSTWKDFDFRPKYTNQKSS